MISIHYWSVFKGVCCGFIFISFLVLQISKTSIKVPIKQKCVSVYVWGKRGI